MVSLARTENGQSDEVVGRPRCFERQQLCEETVRSPRDKIPDGKSDIASLLSLRVKHSTLHP